MKIYLLLRRDLRHCLDHVRDLFDEETIVKCDAVESRQKHSSIPSYGNDEQKKSDKVS